MSQGAAEKQQKQGVVAALLSLRVVQQSAVLTWKNLLVAWRNRRATLLRLLAPFVFLLLALVIQLSLDANSRRQERIREADAPPPVRIAQLPTCHQDLYIASKPCVNFLYSPNSSSLVKGIIDGMRLRNTPPMAEDQVLGFASRVQAEDWMTQNPENTLGAVHFTLNEAATPPGIRYTIQTNSTTKGFRGSYQSPVTFFTLPLASAVAREVARVQLAAAVAAGGAAAGLLPGAEQDLQWDPRLVPFPHPQLRSIGMLGYVLAPFIFAACMFSMVQQLGAVVGEKEGGQLTALQLMGLRQSAYWTSWVTADLLLGMITALSIVVWGLILQFRFFLRNDAGLLLLLFWLFSIALSSFSYALSTFISRAQTATYTGFAVFLVGWICQTTIAFGLPYSPDNFFAPSGVGRAFFWIFALLPWCPLSKATMDLASATNTNKSPGLRWGQRSSYCQYVPDVASRPPVDPTEMYVNYDCIYSLHQCYVTLALQAVGWLVLAIYLDNVLPGPQKRARSFYYFLLPSYWLRWRGAADNNTGRSGLSARRQQQLLLLAQTTASASARAVQQEAEGPAADARVDMSGGAGGSSGSLLTSVDEGVAAEEAAMQALLLQLLPPSAQAAAAAAAGARRTSPSTVGGGGGAHAQVRSTPSWPQLQSAEVPQEQQASAPNAGDSSSADGKCDIADAAAAGKGSSSSSCYDFGGFAVAVFGLSKVFKAAGCRPSSSASGCRGGGGGRRDFHALRGLWLGIRPGQLLCLLGPNGAAKSTTINCLTGLLAPSGGEMLICGESILTEGGLDRARREIGVCPQHDVLWEELTGREHLLVAGHVKGLPWAQVSGAASDLLSGVQLSHASRVRSAAYSGGMKRRLSVALALVGDPKVLFLDEPTTGMDPISRRAVWDVVQEAKQGRAVVLTTHSMEEADVLGDRIAILARGRLRALGSSIRLKQKFGTGYQVVVNLLDPRSSSSNTAVSNAATTTSSTSNDSLRQPPGGLLRQRRGGSKQEQEQEQQGLEAGPEEAADGATGAADGGVGVSSWEQQQQQAGVSPGVLQTGPAPTPHQLATVSSSSSSSGTGSTGGSSSSSNVITSASVAATRAAVRRLFAEHLQGLAPAEESRRSLHFLVPRSMQQQLRVLLQQLEAAMAAGGSSGGGSSSGGGGGSSSSSQGGVMSAGLSEEGARQLAPGVADVQLSLTSLEEVFLSIAKQAELEASAESGATATITLPDSGLQVKVAVGQDWVQVDAAAAAAAAGARRGRGRAGAAAAAAVVTGVTAGGDGGSLSSNGAGGVQAYSIKWVQDDNGALAVLEVVPLPAAAWPQQGVSAQSGSQAVAPVAV